MKILTASQMREVDQKTINEIGIPGTTLMENAGIHVVRAMEEHFEHLDLLNVAIVAGRGNNGGDGFVVARQLYMRGIIPHVFILSDEDSIKGDAKINFQILKNYGDIPITRLKEDLPIKELVSMFEEYQLIVDAILGTGVNKPVEGFYAKVIDAMNQTTANVVSIDFPSGLFADEYRPVETAVYADMTVTFTAPKPGLILGEAYTYVGELYTVNIGSPEYLLDNDKHYLNLVTEEDIQGFFVPRKKTTHKGNYGHLLVVGGCYGKIGAVKMASLAALRSGVGLTTVAVPREYFNQSTSHNPEIMSEGVKNCNDGYFTESAAGEIVQLLDRKDFIVLGPGLGCNDDTVSFIQNLLPRVEVPMVIDADGINCIAKDISLLKKIEPKVILTPHPGEMARLAGVSTGEVQENRESIAREFARKYGVYLVLKGYRTLTAEPSGQIWVNPTGNPGMATGGMGDVLSGILGAFCTRINQQNPKAWTLAITAGVYIHGLAGDIAAEAFTEESLIATDVINHLHVAINKIKGSE